MWDECFVTEIIIFISKTFLTRENETANASIKSRLLFRLWIDNHVYSAYITSIKSIHMRSIPHFVAQNTECLKYATTLKNLVCMLASCSTKFNSIHDHTPL